MRERATLMTEGPVWKHILRFALPLFWGSLFQQLYNVVDSLIVGNLLGSDALAAVSSSGNLIFLLTGFFTGISAGTSIVISRYFGARDTQNLSAAVHTTAAFGITAGILVSVCGTLAAPQLLRWMGTPESVLPNSIRYFQTYFSGAVFVVLYNSATSIFQAVGDSRHPLYYLIISSITNVVLDLLFVGPLGLGVGGAALATVLSQALSAALGFWKLTHTTGEYRIWPRRIRFHAHMLRQVMVMGLPSGIQNSIIAFANVIVQSSINMFGAMAMAGCGSYSKLEGFAFLPMNCFNMAAATFIGQNLGAKEYDRARRGARFNILICMFLAELVGIVFNLLAPQLISLFNSDPQVVAYGVMQARTMTLFYCLLAFSHAVSAALRGAGRAIVPMLVMLLCWCVIRVTYIMLIARTSGNIQMIFWAYPLTWSLSSIIFVIYYYKADWLHYLDRKEQKA